MSYIYVSHRNLPVPDHMAQIGAARGRDLDDDGNAARRARFLEADKYEAIVRDTGSVPLMATYKGTRRKDGWHYMEVRIRSCAQVRRYVNPKYVEWKGEPPEIKWGDKMKDFM